MWFEDLTEYAYFDEEQIKALIAVGWLENGRPFAIGDTSENVYKKLYELKTNPWQFAIAAGVHICDLCGPESNFAGNSNLTIPHKGKLYFCPELITHYIEKHSYLPPKEFCEAALACPPMDSVEYKNKLLENGGEILLGYFEE